MVEQDVVAMASPLDALKAYLRIESGDEDALLAGLLRAAEGTCEAFIGQWLIARQARETVIAAREWTRLSARPVAAIEAVEGLDAAGGAVALSVETYAIDIDGAGDGWVRVTAPTDATHLRVSYRAGMAADMNGLPEAVRQGIVRLAAEYHATRTGDEAAMPAVVTALWRPWRRMRLA